MGNIWKNTNTALSVTIAEYLETSLHAFGIAKINATMAINAKHIAHAESTREEREQRFYSFPTLALLKHRPQGVIIDIGK